MDTKKLTPEYDSYSLDNSDEFYTCSKLCIVLEDLQRGTFLDNSDEFYTCSKLCIVLEDL